MIDDPTPATVTVNVCRHVKAAVFALDEGLLDVTDVMEIIDHQFARIASELAKMENPGHYQRLIHLKGLSLHTERSSEESK